ncbi:MAG: hypothetical protein JWO03_3251 [Bacteroidetes bacterium]|nr:hypothetical protein [Bacteroidota bacterium]
MRLGKQEQVETLSFPSCPGKYFYGKTVHWSSFYNKR